jgi:hypothetical protein
VSRHPALTCLIIPSPGMSSSNIENTVDFTRSVSLAPRQTGRTGRMSSPPATPTLAGVATATSPDQAIPTSSGEIPSVIDTKSASLADTSLALTATPAVRSHLVPKESATGTAVRDSPARTPSVTSTETPIGSPTVSGTHAATSTPMPTWTIPRTWDPWDPVQECRKGMSAAT